MRYTPRELKDNINVTPTSPLRDFFVMAGGLLAILIGTYGILGLAVDFIAPRIPVDFEKKLAKPMLNSIVTKKTDAEKERFVQLLADNFQRNCAHLPYQFNIVIRQSNTINAIALPGGTIVVFTGLLDKVTSENELAFIIAHEMGHYANRDHLKGIGRALVLMTLSAIIFGSDSGINNFLAHGLNLTELNFSRAQETHADEFALESIDCVYGHTGGAVDFFNKIPKENDPGKFGHYFSTHPDNLRRIAHLEKIIQTKGFNVSKTKQLPKDINASKNTSPMDRK